MVAPGKIVKCPKCGANFDLTPQNYTPQTDLARCPQGHVFPLAGKPLTMSTKMAEVEELGKTMLKASDVGDWDTYNKAKERREQLIREMREEEAKVERVEAVASAMPKRAAVTEKEIPMFTPAFLSKVKRAWETRKTQSFWDWIIEPASYGPHGRGVYVRLTFVKKPHEFFPPEVIEKMEYDEEEKVYRVMEERHEIKKWKLHFTSPMGFEHFVEVEAYDLDEAKEKAEKEVPKGSTYRGQVG